MTSSPAGLVQQVTMTQVSSTTLVLTVAATVPGNKLVISWGNDTAGISSISGGGTWANDELTGQAHLTSGIQSALCTSSVTSITITWSLSSTTAAAAFSEWSGLQSPTPIDTVGNSIGGNSTAPSVGPFTPSVPLCLVYAMVAHRGTFSAGPSGGFTGLNEAKSGTVAIRPAYLIQSAAVAATAGWTLSATANWDTALACYKPGFMDPPPIYPLLLPQ